MAEVETSKIKIVQIYGVRSALSPKYSEVYSIHVMFPLLGLEVRGVSLRYCEKKRRCWIMMPSKKGLKNSKTCHFPLVNFVDKEYQSSVLKEIRQYFISWRKENVFENAEVANDPPRKPQKQPATHGKRPDNEPHLSRLFPRRNSKPTTNLHRESEGSN